MLEIDTKIDDVSLRLSQSGGADLTDVNSSISDLSTRMMAIENSSNITDWTDAFYYTPFSILSRTSNDFDTSALLFHDVIVNANLSTTFQNKYLILCRDTETNNTNSYGVYVQASQHNNILYNN
jgi:hypothetical protein